jgi:hypothetical protein
MAGTVSTPLYVRGLPPKSLPAEAQLFLVQELEKIQKAIALLALGHIDTTYVAPAKPRAGDIRLSDGISWNPGSGAGFYGYYGGAWVKLG